MTRAFGYQKEVFKMQGSPWIF